MTCANQQLLSIQQTLHGSAQPCNRIGTFKFCTDTDFICVVGDVHGDINKAMSCLRLAGVATFDDGVPRWIGGDTIIVQVGDVLDRGDAEIATIMLLRQLHRQAQDEGGAVHILNGNHESLNVCGDFRCACTTRFIANVTRTHDKALVLKSFR